MLDSGYNKSTKISWPASNKLATAVVAGHEECMQEMLGVKSGPESRKKDRLVFILPKDMPTDACRQVFGLHLCRTIAMYKTMYLVRYIIGLIAGQDGLGTLIALNLLEKCVLDLREATLCTEINFLLTGKVLQVVPVVNVFNRKFYSAGWLKCFGVRRLESGGRCVMQVRKRGSKLERKFSERYTTDSTPH